MSEAIWKAQYDRMKAMGWLPFFQKASDDRDVRLDILLAIASRETNIANITGDGGHGRGVMQIDDRSHLTFINNNDGGLDPESNIYYGALVLKNNLAYFNSDYSKAIPAYNCGAGNVSKAVRAGKSPDAYTAHANYGADVLDRAISFRKFLLEDGVDSK